MNKRHSLIISVAMLLILFLFYWQRRDENVMAGSDNSEAISEDEMVKIPQGSFIMGSKDGEFDERPLHKVELNGFYADRYEVTNLQYQRFVLANPYWQKGNPGFEAADYNYLSDWDGAEFPKGKENHPVVYISWHAAAAYSKWAGKSLPTEPQWEYAARSGYEGMRYIWGNSWETHLSNWKGLSYRGVMPVGNFSMNGFGLNDMAGNVWEWTADGYEIYMEGEDADPRPRLNNHLKVIRGGSWNSDKSEMRVSIRGTEKPNVCRIDVGFRCVKKSIVDSQ
jgi:formylglycine-generating enzyme required for sulfatase activity